MGRRLCPALRGSGDDRRARNDDRRLHGDLGRNAQVIRRHVRSTRDQRLKSRPRLSGTTEVLGDEHDGGSVYPPIQAIVMYPFSRPSKEVARALWWIALRLLSRNVAGSGPVEHGARCAGQAARTIPRAVAKLPANAAASRGP